MGVRDWKTGASNTIVYNSMGATEFFPYVSVRGGSYFTGLMTEYVGPLSTFNLMRTVYNTNQTVSAGRLCVDGFEVINYSLETSPWGSCSGVLQLTNQLQSFTNNGITISASSNQFVTGS